MVLLGTPARNPSTLREPARFLSVQVTTQPTGFFLTATSMIFASPKASLDTPLISRLQLLHSLIRDYKNESHELLSRHHFQ